MLISHSSTDGGIWEAIYITIREARIPGLASGRTNIPISILEPPTT
jgi:hypothetical protein